MADLKFSTAEHFPGAKSYFQKQLDSFSTHAGVEAAAEAVPWDKLWLYLQDVMNGDATQDVSEVGSTWAAHFIDKNAVRQFNEREISDIGGVEGFLPATWESARLLNRDEVFAIPWLADTRVVYYWRDDLKSAGVDESVAFSTPKQMARTLGKLKERGKSAWGAPTFEVNNTLHQIASWIWSAGGDFLDETGVRTAFCQPASLKGIHDYYCLYPYMSQNFDSLEEVLDRFEEHRVSVIINGPWFLMRMILGGATSETLADLGAALPPGPPFVGGSNLVVWSGRENSDVAVDLVRHLVSPDVQRDICRTTGLMPVRTEVLGEEPYASDPHYQVFTKALQCGRPMPSIAFWGPLEDSLHKGFGAIWKDLKELRNCDLLGSVIGDHLTPIAKRFDRLLKLVQFTP